MRSVSGIVACLLLLTACGDTAGGDHSTGPPRSGGAMDVQDVIGHELRIVQVSSPAGVTDVPAGGSIEFRPDGHFVADDSINATSGKYTRTPDGLRIGRDIAGTLVGYDGRDPVRTALIDAVHHVAASGRRLAFRRDGDRVRVSSGTYALICTR